MTKYEGCWVCFVQSKSKHNRGSPEFYCFRPSKAIQWILKENPKIITKVRTSVINNSHNNDLKMEVRWVKIEVAKSSLEQSQMTHWRWTPVRSRKRWNEGSTFNARSGQICGVWTAAKLVVPRRRRLETLKENERASLTRVTFSDSLQVIDDG